MTKKTKPRTVRIKGADGVCDANEQRTKDVQNEADEAVMGGQGQQDLVDQDDVLEIVDDGLAVQEVHGCGQPVPVEALGRAQLASAAGDAGDGDDLFEGDDLDGSDDADDVDVAHEEGGEEAGEHDKGPESTGQEVGLLLLILGSFLVFGRLGLLAGMLAMTSFGRRDGIEGACAGAGAEGRRPLRHRAGRGRQGAHLCDVLQDRASLDLGERAAVFADVAEAGAAAIRASMAVGLVGELDPPPCACHHVLVYGKSSRVGVSTTLVLVGRDAG